MRVAKKPWIRSQPSRAAFQDAGGETTPEEKNSVLFELSRRFILTFLTGLWRSRLLDLRSEAPQPCSSGPGPISMWDWVCPTVLSGVVVSLGEIPKSQSERVKPMSGSRFKQRLLFLVGIDEPGCSDCDRAGDKQGCRGNRPNRFGRALWVAFFWITAWAAGCEDNRPVRMELGPISAGLPRGISLAKPCETRSPVSLSMGKWRIADCST